jgi:sigma-B regulation protein RsbU (phosphoserine phosphatase)
MLLFSINEDIMTDSVALRSIRSEYARLREENKDLRDELSLLRSSVRALRVLQDLIENLSPEIDMIKWIDDLLASALAAVSAKDGSLILLDEESGEMVFAVVQGEARDRLTGFRMSPGEGVAGWVVENRKPQIVQDPRNDPRFSPNVDDMLGFRTRSLACVPLIAEDRVLGVIEAINKISDREFTLQDQDLMTLVAHLTSQGISRAESFVDKS